MIQCCRFIDDIELLAGIIGITDDELAKIQQNYRRKEVCALRLIEKWMQKNPQKNKDDLYQLLLAANQRRAAKRLVVQYNYSVCLIREVCIRTKVIDFYNCSSLRLHNA